MVNEITEIGSPIEVMYLVHKALRAEAERAEEMAGRLVRGGSLRPFKSAFNFWAMALGYHTDAENEYMTAPLTGCPPALECQAEHPDLGERPGDPVGFLNGDDARSLSAEVQAVMARNEEQHQELAAKLQGVLALLYEEIGKTRLVARIKRNLYASVVALRTAQDDHLDHEEAFVLPVIQERMSEAQQLEVARHLLVGQGAQDPRWILTWIAQYLTPRERTLLANFEARITSRKVIEEGAMVNILGARICDNCGKRTVPVGAKTCQIGHFICRSCLNRGPLPVPRRYCLVCGLPVHEEVEQVSS